MIVFRCVDIEDHAVAATSRPTPAGPVRAERVAPCDHRRPWARARVMTWARLRASSLCMTLCR